MCSINARIMDDNKDRKLVVKLTEHKVLCHSELHSKAHVQYQPNTTLNNEQN